TEIIIGSQVDDLPSVKNANRLLFAFEHAQPRRHALRAQFLQLIGDVLQRIQPRCDRSGIRHAYTPDWTRPWQEPLCVSSRLRAKQFESKKGNSLSAACHSGTAKSFPPGRSAAT